MKTYIAQAEAAASPAQFCIDRQLWLAWELPAVKAWLLTSRSRRQLLKRMEVAMVFYRSTLWWAMSLAFVPDQHLRGLEPDHYNLEEFCWAGVCPTPEAERQLLEHAAEIGRGYREEPDISPERLQQLLMAEWVLREPVSPYNRYLLEERMLGEYGYEAVYG
jgi:hypothetical protein